VILMVLTCAMKNYCSAFATVSIKVVIAVSVLMGLVNKKMDRAYDKPCVSQKEGQKIVLSMAHVPNTVKLQSVNVTLDSLT